jgi:two-component system cell cycle response regulator
MRALVADDDRTSTTILAGALTKWGLDVTVAHDGNAAWQQLHGVAPPSLAVLDWTMPGISGVDICRRLRRTPRVAGLYTILLTSRDRQSDMVEGLDAGADDFMTKPIDMEELRARVHVGLRAAALQNNLSERVRELQAARDHLARIANTDALTGAYSRRGWFDLAASEFSRCRRYARTFSLLAGDLDFFKRVNDTYGHDSGDAVLHRFAEMLRAECRQSDIIGRLGGEEFAVVLPETPVAAAATLATRITAACRALAVETPTGVVRLSCSIGLTELRDDDASIESVLRRGDAALYEAKRSGRDRWRHAA